jgi:hypothetical protein
MAEEEKDENFEQILKEIDAEEEGGSVEPKAEEVEVDEEEEEEESGEGAEKSGNPDASYYPHIGIMEEEGIDKDSLPEDIRKMVITFERKKRMAERKNAPDSTFLKIRNLSALIADKIMDWIEKDFEGEAPKPTAKEDGGGVEEDIVEEGGEGEEKESGGSIFGGILGGIFDW